MKCYNIWMGGNKPLSGYSLDVPYLKEDIFGSISASTNIHYIREVTIPDTASIELISNYPQMWQASMAHLEEAREIDADVVTELCNEGAYIHAYNGRILRWACRQGHYNIAKRSIKHMEVINNCGIREASIGGHTDIVKLLLESGIDANADDGYPLRWASRLGHTEVVKVLLDNGADVSVDNNMAFYWAARGAHADIVELLLENGLNIHECYHDVRRSTRSYKIIAIIDKWYNTRYKYRELL